MTLNGVIPDTSTSASNSSFRKVYSSAATLPIASTWDFTGDATQIWQLSIEAGSSIPTISLALSGGSRVATYRTNTTVVATTSSTAKITFYANKKIIPGCRNVLSSAGTASCTWRPTVMGVSQITTKVSATDASFADFTTGRLDLSVVKRTNTR
jgi:hypothetical protein